MRYDPVSRSALAAAAVAGDMAQPRSFVPVAPPGPQPWRLVISPALNRLFAASARKAGNAARDRRDWTNAAAAYRRYLAYDAGNVAIQVQLGHMLKEAGDTAAAAAVYDTALRQDPGNSELLIWIGDLHRREGRLDAALEAFRASHAIDGNAVAARDVDALLERIAAEAAPADDGGADRPARWVGHVDVVNGAVVTGWALDPDAPGTPVAIDFFASDRHVGSTTANTPREDLRGIGGLGFRTLLDLAGVPEGAWIDARLCRTGEPLRDTPFQVLPPAAEPDAPLASAARYVVVKPLAFAGGELALFVTHSKTGAIKPHVLPHVLALKAQGIATLLIAVGDRPVDIDDALAEAVAGAIVRENRGYDFACWAQAMRIFPEAYGASLLYWLNDSIYGPADAGRFAAMIARVRASEADLIGLTESHEHNWHVQSYFLALKPRLLSWLTLHDFIDGVRMYDDKDRVIQTYEIAFAPMVERGGLRVEVLFRSHAVRNPTLFGWRALLEAGFPYVKMLLLRGAFPEIALGDWRDTVARHGFDVPLLEATLETGAEGWAPAPGHALVARPRAPRAVDGQPLKIAFFGPWNYDNGLGAASRGLIAAIRRCHVQLNLHPIEKPFHVHKPLAPPVSVSDFAGPADIAVVHLNPDSWHLLTDDQRALIAQAGKRIGYWVWEMGHIPPAWRAEFSSVDRIWAPSGYCADLFAAQHEAPVDVVPHSVPLPATHLSDADRARLRAAIGVPAGNRVILYAFDGSSYLVRKNPAALLRAFAASGLGAKGWSLVLKTKHLFDRPEEGRALDALARATPGAVLLNTAMPAGDMTSLLALCDIYASPHCSEGFGLTIAEAMAEGKAVVATDFSGSTQYLDASCGYPVAAEAWTLTEDFGHYTRGGTWARIDEAALADALVDAARAIEAGDGRIGEAARRRVAETLSYEAVGARIAASFADTIGSVHPHHPATPRIVADLSLGTRFDRVALGDQLIPIPLAADMTPPRTLARAGLPADRDTWLVFAPRDAIAAPLFARAVEDFVAGRPDVDIVYTDDLAVGAPQARDQLRLKPAFDVALLAAQDYIGAPLIVRASAFARLDGFDGRAGAAALSDLLFRAHALGMAIVPLHQTLLAWDGPRPVVPRAVRRAMLARLPAFAGHEFVDGRRPDTLEQRRRFAPGSEPAVTIVVPTCRSRIPGGRAYVEQLLERLAETDWPMERLHVLVGDDLPDTPEWAHDRHPFRLTRLPTPRGPGEPFNYAAKMNRLWRAADTEHLVLMNDDVAPIHPGWLRALMTFAVDGGVGGVGARLLYEDGRVQHAGIAPLFDLVAHAWLGGHADDSGYQGWLDVHREWSMLTGAVFATRRSMMEQVDGFEERFSLEYNDVDLCLRMRALGYRMVCTPHAELVHTEKASRGAAQPPGDDLALFLERWRPWLRQDPAFHPGLCTDRLDLEPRIDPHAWYA